MSIARLTVVFVLATVSLAPIRAATQSADASAELADLDRRLQQAVVAGDADLLERHLADDFVFTHAGGARDGKADWVTRAKAVPRPYLARNVSDQVIELHGDIALVFGRLAVRVPPSAGAAAAPQCYALQYVHLYARRHGKWIFLSHRTMQMMEQPHPCGGGRD